MATLNQTSMIRGYKIRQFKGLLKDSSHYRTVRLSVKRTVVMSN